MESSPGTARKELNRVRLGVLLSATLFFAPVIAAMVMSGREWIVALIFPVVLCVPHLLTLPRLSGTEERLKKGLKGASNIASAGIMFWGVVGGVPTALALINNPDRMERATLTVVLTLFSIGVLGVLLHSFIRRNTRAAHAALRSSTLAAPRHVLGGLGLAAYYGLILFWALAVLPGMRRDHVGHNETSAVGSLRAINTASFEYQATYKNGYPPSLAALSLPTDAPATGMQPTCVAADLIDTVIAGGQKAGYIFTYTPGPPVKEPAAGCPPGAESYTVTARPRVYSKTGRRSFFTDESGMIRMTSADRTATASDPPIN